MDPVFFATLISPALAVSITLAYESYRRSREERLHLLRVVMVTRLHPADPSFVMAMNSVPLAFNRSIRVVDAHAKCLHQLNSIEPDDDARKQKHWEESDRRLSTLVFEMMRNLGFKATEADVQRAGYVSRGFSVRDRLSIDSQIAMIRIADATEKNTSLLETIYEGSNQRIGSS